MRRHIELAREQSIAQPQHERERADAPPNVLQALWLELHGLTEILNLSPEQSDTRYNPEVYAAVFDHLLKHRQRETLWVNKLLPASGSVYNVEHIESELLASLKEVQESLELIEAAYTAEELERTVTLWYDYGSVLQTRYSKA